MFWTAEHEQLENLWQSRLKDARAQYGLVAAQSKTAGVELTNRILPAPDGASLVSAIRAEKAARDEYSRVLRIFTDLVVSGKRPKE